MQPEIALRTAVFKMVNPDGHRLMLHSHEWPTSGQWTRKHKFSTSSRGGAGSDHSRRLLLCNARDAETLRQQAHPAGECNVKDAVYKDRKSTRLKSSH